MKKVLLFISLICLLPFASMAQLGDGNLEQSYGRSPVARNLPRSVGMNTRAASDLGYGMLVPSGTDGYYYGFDVTSASLSLQDVESYSGFYFTSAELVPLNSTTYYVYAYTSDGRFCKLDPTDGSILAENSVNVGMTELTYDRMAKKMYGLSLGVIYEIDLSTGTATAVNSGSVGSNNWIALASDAEGELYGVVNTYGLSTADFYHINTTTWNVLLLGNTGYKTHYTQSMSFDRDNGILYWWQASNEGYSFLEVDPETGACTPIWEDNGYEMSGLHFYYSPVMYQINYASAENGSVSGVTSAAENDTVFITANPDSHYRLDQLTYVTSETGATPVEIDLTEEPYYFIMPDADVTVTPAFALNVHNITVCDPKDGSLASDPVGEAEYSSTVTAIPTIDPGFGIGTLYYTNPDNTQTDISAAPYQFEMPDYDIEICGTYVQTGSNEVSISTEYYGYFDDIVTIEVNLENECYVAGTQMEIPLGDNLTFVEGSLELTTRAAGTGWNISGNVVEGNILKVTTFNTSLAHYDGNAGAIFSFQVKCGRVEGDNELAINGLYMGTPDATSLTATTVAGNVLIKDVVMNQPENQVVCHNTATEDVVFTTTIPTSEGPITYNWVNHNEDINLAANGQGNIASFIATNETTATIIDTIEVAPTLIHNGNPCVGSTKTFTITVNPKVVMDAIADQELCHNTDMVDVVFSTTLTDGTMTYNWESSNANVGGIEASGTGDITGVTVANETTTSQKTVITVTPTYTNNGIDCVGDPISFNIIVNPQVVMDTPADQEICHGTATADVIYATTIEDGTMRYDWTCDNANIGGLDTIGVGNILSFVGTNETTTSQTAVITVTPTYISASGMECTGEPISYSMTVNPHVVMETPADQEICHGTATADVIYSTTIEDGTMRYDWTRDNENIGGLAMSGTGDILSFEGTNETTTAQTTVITVTPTYISASGMECTGEPISYSMTVNPHVVMETPADQEICHGTATADVIYATTIEDGTMRYDWTRDNETFVGLAMSGTGDILSFEGTNETTTAQTTVITVTPTYISASGMECTGEPISYSMTVNPHVVMDQPDNISVCHGESTSDIMFGTIIEDGTMRYDWTRDNANIGGLDMSGVGNISSFVATNTTTTLQVSTITITPTYISASGMECTGESMTFTLTVSPEIVMDTPDSQVVCHNDNTTKVEFTTSIEDGTVIYTWTNDNPAIGLAASGEGDIESFIATNTTNATAVANIEVTPTYSNNDLVCVGVPVVFTITVNPQVVMNVPENQAVCHNANLTDVVFTTPITDGTMTYSWESSNPNVGGLAVSGTGDMTNIVVTNTTTMAQVTTITVTPTYTNNGIDCVGEPVMFTITVNPEVVMETPADQALCHNATMADVVFATSITDGMMSYSWTRDNENIGGLAMNGTSDMMNIVVTNNTNMAQVTTITVTPTYTNNGIDCVGEPVSFTITVNPEVVMDVPSSLWLCHGETTDDIYFSTLIEDGEMSYSWTRDNENIGGLALNGEGNILSFVASNTTTTAQTSVITVVPTYTNNGVSCEGEPVSFEITVNPSAVMDTPENQALCNGDATLDINFTSPIEDGVVTYVWTNDTPSIGLAASGTGNIPSFVAVNNGSTDLVATITVSPIYANNDIECPGTPVSFTISVWPTPVVTYATPESNYCPLHDMTITADVTVGAAPYTATWSGDLTPSNYSINGNQITATYYLPECNANYNLGVSITDAHGCVSEANTVAISVYDEEAPVIAGNIYGVQPLKEGNCTFIYPDLRERVRAITSDNCTETENLVISQYPAEGSTIVGFGQQSVTVTVTDGCGNTSTLDITVYVPEELTVNGNSTMVSNILCNGDSSGSITVYVSGGESQFTYELSGAQTANSGTVDNPFYTFSNLIAGDYTVTVTDANGCVTSENYTLTEPEVLNLSLVYTHPATCHGDDDAHLVVKATGGVAPYVYQINVPAESFPLAEAYYFGNLSAGQYVATVTDANGCVAVLPVEAFEPDVINISFDNFQSPTCAGNHNGFIHAQVEGGTPGFTYLWTPGNQTGSTATGLDAGTYTVHVTDQNGCYSEATFTLEAPQSLSVGITSQRDVTCNGGNDGSATLACAGGEEPYDFFWNETGAHGASADNLVAGVYTVTVSDANGCSADVRVSINEPDGLAAGEIASDGEELCDGETASTISSKENASTGQNTIYYRWKKNGNVIEGANNATYTPGQMPAGSYVFTREAKDSCTDWTESDGSWTVVVSNAPVVTISGELAIELGHTATLTAHGADSYLWSTGATTETIEVAPDATTTYSVIGYVNNCEAEAEVTVTVSLDVNEFAQHDVELFPNPTNAKVNVRCQGMKEVIVMTVSGQVIEKHVADADVNEMQIDLGAYEPGVYVMTIATNDGVMTTKRVTVVR